MCWVFIREYVFTLQYTRYSLFSVCFWKSKYDRYVWMLEATFEETVKFGQQVEKQWQQNFLSELILLPINLLEFIPEHYNEQAAQ